MIEINLLPGAKRKKSAAASGGSGGGGGPSLPKVDFGAMAKALPGLAKDKFLIGGVAVFVLSLGAALYMFVSQSREKTALVARYEQALKDSVSYSTKIRSRRRAEAIRDTLLREVNLIENIDGDRYIWPHVLDELSRNLAPYTWLTTMNYSGAPQAAANVVAPPPLSPSDTSADERKKHPYKAPKRLDTEIPHDNIALRLVGNTVDLQAMTRYMDDLEASPFLTKVTLDDSHSTIDQGKEVTQFQLTIQYRRPDPALLHRVPLSLTLSQATAR